jgi:DNA-binding MarR family transcriptional regulator
MEEKQLVLIDSSDGQRLIELTAAGQALHDRIVVVALERERLLTRDFTEAERQMLFVLLRRMLSNMEAVNAWDPMAEPRPQRRRRPV